MHDEIDGRLWAAHGAAFGNSIAAFLKELKIAMCKLNELQFSAPWKTRRPCNGR